MSTNRMKLTGTSFGVAAAFLVLALPAHADEKIPQSFFVIDMNEAFVAGGQTLVDLPLGIVYQTDGFNGSVTVPSGQQLEVFNFGGGQGVITVDGTVTLSGEDSELNLAEGTDLLFQDGGGAHKDFTIVAAGAGFEIEVQVKKNSTIEAGNFTIDISGAEEAEAQFEENFTLILYGDLTLSMSTGTDEGGDVQFKKFADISVEGDITLDVSGEDSEIQVEEESTFVAGGSITLTGDGLGSQVQTKKNVTFAAGVNISLTAPGSKSEVQCEENNDFDAGGHILLSAGVAGKMEVKKFTDLDAGGDIDVLSGGECKIEADKSAWSAGGLITTCD